MARHALLATALATCLQFSAVLGFSNTRRASNSTNSTEFAWKDLKPSEALVDWTPCYDEFECARFSVPMDWTASGNSTKHFDLALTKLPANVSESSPEWKGPLLINPGGPGASGTAFAVQMGKELQAIVGGDYSIIGFDPRGVAFTTPAISCFPDQLHRSLWVTYTQDIIAHSNVAVQYARSKALSAVCEPRAIETGAEYVNTPSVARDMIAITEAAWETAGATSPSEKGVIFWGFSYGTALGQTFATMFPNRVHRFVLDGVLSVADWYGGNRVVDLLDSTNVVDYFFRYCSQAGAAACPFYGNESAIQIRGHLDDLLQRLETAPIPYKTDAGDPDVITSLDVYKLIFTVAYTPLSYFKPLAEVLAIIDTGKGVDITTYVRTNVTCEDDPLQPNTGEESGAAIGCSEVAAGIWSNMTLSQFENSLDLLTRESPYTGGAWAQYAAYCLGWNIRPKGLVYNGTKWGATTKEGILFNSNMADPVTPLESAQNAAQLFPGAVLLTQNSVGHATISSPSVCTSRYVRDYFRTGTLPPNGTRCDPDELPFGLSPNNSTAKRSVTDLQLKQAAKKASELWVPGVLKHLGKR